MGFRIRATATRVDAGWTDGDRKAFDGGWSGGVQDVVRGELKASSSAPCAWLRADGLWSSNGLHLLRLVLPGPPAERWRTGPLLQILRQAKVRRSFSRG